MVPESTAAFVAFLLLVAPGIIFNMLRDRQRPAREESTFREVSVTALASLMFSGMSLLLLALVRAVLPSLMPDPRLWLETGSEYVKSNYQFVARFLAAEVLLAIALALLADLALRHRNGATIRAGSVWYRVFRASKPSGTYPFVRVQLKNQVIYRGRVGEYATDPSLGDRELVLVPPISVKMPGKPAAPLSSGWQKVVIPASAIEVLRVSYVLESRLALRPPTMGTSG